MSFTIPREIFEEGVRSRGYQTRRNGSGGISAVLHRPDGVLQAFCGPTFASFSAKYARGRDPQALRRRVEADDAFREALAHLGATLVVDEESLVNEHGLCAVGPGFAHFDLMANQIVSPCPPGAFERLLQAFQAAVLTGALPYDVSCQQCGQLPADLLPSAGPFGEEARLCPQCRPTPASSSLDLRGWLTPGRDPGLFRNLEIWASEVGAPAPARLECKSGGGGIRMESATVLEMPVQWWDWLAASDFQALAKEAMAHRTLMAGLQEEMMRLFSDGSLADLEKSQEKFEAQQARMQTILESSVPAEERDAACARACVLEALGDDPYGQPVSAWQAVLEQEGRPVEWPSAARLARLPEAPASRLLTGGTAMVELLRKELSSPPPAPSPAPPADLAGQRRARLVQRWRQWLGQNPDRADGWQALAGIHESAEEWSLAVEAAEQALARNPNHSAALETLANARQWLDRPSLPPDARWLLTDEP